MIPSASQFFQGTAPVSGCALLPYRELRTPLLVTAAAESLLGFAGPLWPLGAGRSAAHLPAARSIINAEVGPPLARVGSCSLGKPRGEFPVLRYVAN